MSTTEKENKLLQKIKQPFPSKKNNHFHCLMTKRDNTTLSSEEYGELLSLTTTFEKYELRRLKLLTKLAVLKKISLPEVIHLYNLHPINSHNISRK